MAGHGCQPVAQFLHMFRAMFVEVNRVQSQRGVDLRFTQRQIPHALQIALIDTQYDHPLDTHLLAAIEHCLAVGLEVIEIQVGVGVDQPHVQAS